MHFAEDGGGGVVEDVEVWHSVLVEEGGEMRGEGERGQWVCVGAGDGLITAFLF